MSELSNVRTNEILHPYDRDAHVHIEDLFEIGSEIVQVSLDQNEELEVKTDPWLFKVVAQDRGFEIDHTEAIAILEEIINEKSRRLVKQTKILEMASLYFNEDTAVFKVADFKESYFEEFGVAINDNEVDTLVDIMQQYRKKES